MLHREAVASRLTIAIIGATGLVGTELYRILDREKFRVVVVGRSSKKLKDHFPTAMAHMTWADFEASNAQEYAALVNIAGASVSGTKWTDDYKQIMVDSRIEATRLCVEKCRENQDIHLINASAVSSYGFYEGPSIRFTEHDRDQRTGSAFLQELIDEWEANALQAKAFGNAVTLLRIGVVLDPDEGALPEMMKPFKMFLGGPIGTGQQMMSWISTEDVARIIAFLLETKDLTGPVNCTSPGACSNRQFAKALGHAINRPGYIRTPAFVIRAAMGQMGDELIVKGQHVYPDKLLEAGFTFNHLTIEDYFDKTFGGEWTSRPNPS